jgi:octaprenyl-diphosphate synthase
MPLRLDDIKAPIAREMEAFEPKFRASMKSNVLLLDKDHELHCKAQGETNASHVCLLVGWNLWKN